MSRPQRLEFSGAVYHVIARGNEQREVFRDDSDRKIYLRRLAHYRDRFRFRLYAYCLMTNHVYLAVETGPVPLSRIVLALHGSYRSKVQPAPPTGRASLSRALQGLTRSEDLLPARPRPLHSRESREGRNRARAAALPLVKRSLLSGRASA